MQDLYNYIYKYSDMRMVNFRYDILYHFKYINANISLQEVFISDVKFIVFRMINWRIILEFEPPSGVEPLT